jgi:esterase
VAVPRARPVKLHYEEFGGRGLPIVILHGLFASSRNWVSVGRFLAGVGRPFALDLRNHGDSPHADSHTLGDLISDLRQWLSEHELERPLLLGHSMGGLAAMGFALRYPRAVRGLIVVDIAPRAYHPRFEREFEALSLDITGYSSRSQIEEALQPVVPDRDVRQFLLMNAEHADGGFRWKLNVPVLKRSEFLEGPDFSSLAGEADVPALLVAGGESEYVREDDITLFKRTFPNGSVAVIPGCGHWLHFICSEQFEGLLRRFIGSLEPTGSGGAAPGGPGVR